MPRRLAAIVFIFLCTSAAWMILGATVMFRTYSADAALGGRVASSWGTALAQKPPQCTVKPDGEGGRCTRLTLAGSRIDVALDLQPRRKGFLWYSTYGATFQAKYTFEAPPAPHATFRLPLPALQAVYDGVQLDVDGVPVTWTRSDDGLVATVDVAPGTPHVFGVRYRTRGLDSWRYEIDDRSAPVRDFALDLRANFRNVDFPASTLSPTSVRPDGAGVHLTWAFEDLVSGLPIQVTTPARLQPGPVTGRIAFFAPVSLLFFFFVLLVITTVRRVELHPMNYFFLAAAFFAFHLLLAYLADQVPIHWAFAVAAATSVFLVVSYLRLVVGLRFALVEAGLAQAVYLVLFSSAFFLEGLTGLAVTIGAVITLFVTMQVTARIRWAERFARPVAAPAPEPR